MHTLWNNLLFMMFVKWKCSKTSNLHFDFLRKCWRELIFEVCSYKHFFHNIRCVFFLLYTVFITAWCTLHIILSAHLIRLTGWFIFGVHARFFLTTLFLVHFGTHISDVGFLSSSISINNSQFFSFHCIFFLFSFVLFVARLLDE